MCEHKQLCNIFAQIIYSNNIRATTISYFICFVSVIFHWKIKIEIKILTDLLISYGQNMCQNILDCGVTSSKWLYTETVIKVLFWSANELIDQLFQLL